MKQAQEALHSFFSSETDTTQFNIDSCLFSVFLSYFDYSILPQGRQLHQK